PLREICGGSIQMAKKQQTHTPQLVEMRRQLEEENRQQCQAIVAEFSAGAGPVPTMQAMAKAILRYRRALATLSLAVEWAKQGKPITVIGPGPHWGPRRTVEDDAAPPAA